MTSPFYAQGEYVYSPKMRSQSLVRRQVPLGGTGYVALAILREGTPVDAEAVSIRVFRKNDWETFTETDALGELLLEADGDSIKRDAVGHYHFPLDAGITGEKAYLTVVWTYTVEGHTTTYLEHLEVREAMPTYDALTDAEKVIVEQVSWMFADLHDSTNGGPHLLEPFQSHFGFERIAQLMHTAAVYLNTGAAPMTMWFIGRGAGRRRTPTEMHGMLLRATYLEVVKHLMRSYVEIPEFRSMSVTYTDRQQYMQRWQSIYQTEKPDFDRALKLAKRAYLPLGRSSVLVAGGIYGGGAKGPFFPGMYAAQVRSYRFYPAAPAMAWSNANMDGPGPWLGRDE